PKRELARQLGDSRLVRLRFDRFFYCEIQGGAVDNVRLVRQLTVLADACAADEADTELRPGGLYRQDRYVPVDQGPTRNVPPVVVVVDVETSERHEYLTEADRERVAELELAPHLLNRDFAAVAAFEVLRERRSHRCALQRALHFDFRETLELDLDVRLQTIVWRRVRGEDEAPEVETRRLRFFERVRLETHRAIAAHGDFVGDADSACSNARRLRSWTRRLRVRFVGRGVGCGRAGISGFARGPNGVLA